ncbi:MAG: N-acyl homoserine lactonase family protein [Armatimonadetes bacterium]|nr:N-acyl homoserine lactonase family protein [Armatimonadota bacterium]
MAQHVIRPVVLHRTRNVPQQLFAYLTGVGPPHTIATAVWYIQGPDEHILVDAGGTTETNESVMRMLAPSAVVEHIQTMDEGLDRLGLKPEDIDIVVVTHLHLDHVEMAHELVNARFVVQKADYDYIADPHPSVAGAYVGKAFLEGLDIEVIEGRQTIVEGVEVWPTPGHTPGGQSVIVDTAAGKAVITGFCCVLENFEPPAEVRDFMPVVAPGVHMDVMRVYDSLVMVKEFADIVVPIHDARYAEMDSIG